MDYFKKEGFEYRLTAGANALKFDVKTSVGAETIENIVVTALECTSNYWVGVDNTTPEWKEKPEDMPVSQYATQLILDDKYVVLYDIEDEDEQWTLDLCKILKGIGLGIQKGYDINDCEEFADEILQLSLFGELVYG